MKTAMTVLSVGEPRMLLQKDWQCHDPFFAVSDYIRVGCDITKVGFEWDALLDGLREQVQAQAGTEDDERADMTALLDTIRGTDHV